MADGELIDAVIFICPNCGFEEFESVEELRKSHGFKGNNLKSLPRFECHGCHRFRVKARQFKKIPAEWLEPF